MFSCIALKVQTDILGKREQIHAKLYSTEDGRHSGKKTICIGLYKSQLHGIVPYALQK